MPPFKGPLERGYTLQAQEQGTGTTPRQRGDSQGTPSLSLREGEEGDWGELPRARGCGQHSRVPLVLGEPPEEARHPPLRGEGVCSGRTVDATVRPARRPPRDHPGGVPARVPSCRHSTEGTGAQRVPDAFPLFYGESGFCPNCTLPLAASLWVEAPFTPGPGLEVAAFFPSLPLSRGLRLNILPAPWSGLLHIDW